MERFKINDRIKIVGKNVKGKVVFVGETHFADGTLYGVAMDDPIGRHDGIMNGVRYFKCKENHGIFVKASQLQNVGNGIERSGGSKETTTKKKSSNGSNQETSIHSEKPNCKRETAMKSSTAENGSKMREYTQPCPQRKFKFKPKDRPTIEDQSKNMTDSAKKSSPAENGSKPRNYTQPCQPKKFKLKSKERLTTVNQTKKITERKNDPGMNDMNLTESKSKDCMKLKGENDVLNNEISYKDGQLATLQSELSRLKSCIHWSRKFSNSNSFKDINLKRFFTQEIDVRIKNMEDTIKNPDAKPTNCHFKDYKTLKEHNRFLQLYVVDLEKQTELLMETILRIRGIVLRQRKKRRSDQKGNCKNYLQKHVGKFLKENAFSSQTFTDDEMAACSSRISRSSFDRDLESLADTIPNANKDESQTFEPHTGITSQKQGISSHERSISPKDEKDDDKKSAESIPDSEDYYMTTTSFPVWHKSPETKMNKKPLAKKRYDPYPRNLIHNKEKKPTLVSKNTFKYIPKGLEELSSKLATVSKKPSRLKLNSKTPPHLLAKGARQYEMLNIFGANKQTRKDPSKLKATNANILAKGKKSVYRQNSWKKKPGYSTQATIKK